MTALAKRKTRARFETAAKIQGRAVIIEAEPYIARVRLKGQRTTFEISWEGIFMLAAKCAAEKLRAERMARRRHGRLRSRSAQSSASL